MWQLKKPKKHIHLAILNSLLAKWLNKSRHQKKIGQPYHCTHYAQDCYFIYKNPSMLLCKDVNTIGGEEGFCLQGRIGNKSLH